MPQAIAAAVVSFIGLTGTTAAIVSAAVQVAIYAGVAAVAKQNTEKKDQGGLINLELNPSAPRRLVVGKRAIGGNLVDWYVSADRNSHLFLPIYLSEGPCGTITKVFTGGREVHSVPLVHGVRTALTEFRSGGDRLFLTYYDGRVGQTADPQLVGLGQGWTSDNKMTGCAWVLAEMWWDSDNMRAPVPLVFEFEGAKFYDRRKDSTAGGSGTHRLTNPATWELGDAEGANPAVVLDHYQLGRYWNGQRVFGIGMAPEDVPYDRFAAQANICDENVDLKAGGTQKRYRANGTLDADEAYDSAIKQLCKAMAAEPADFGGRVGVVGIEARTPVLTIDDDDLIDGAGEDFDPKRSWGELVGAIEGKFQDPAQLYQPVPYPEATDAAWATEDGGEPKRVTHDLEFETNVERAQRLAMLKAKYERRQAILKGTYPFFAIELERGDWFVRTGRAGSRFGEAGKTFEVMDRILDPKTLLVSVIAKEVDATDSAWDESAAQDGPPAPIASTSTTLATVEVPAITVTAISLVGSASSVPALKVSFTTPSDPRVKWLYVEVENLDGVTPKVTKNVAIPADVNEVVFSDGIVDGDGYAVAAKFITDTLRSEWCVAEIIYSAGTYAVGHAASVDWSGVVGAGKPADDATKNVTTIGSSAPSSPTDGDMWCDTSSTPYVWKLRKAGAWSAVALNGSVFGSSIYEAGGGAVAALAAFKTALGIASGFTGQTDLATTTRASLDFGVNAAVNSEWTAPGTYPPAGWESGSNQTAGATTRTIVTGGPRNAMKGANTTTPANATVFDIVRQRQGLAELKKCALPVNPGDRVAASVRLAHNASVSSVAGIFVFWDAAGNFVSGGPALSSVTNVANGDTGDPADYVVSSGTVIIPATVKFVTIVAGRATCNGGANPTAWAMSPLLARVPTGQTAIPQYTPGAPDRMADQTLISVSAGFTGQGAFATLSSVAYGSGFLTGFGTLAALSNALGLTAGGITGQGALATRGDVYLGSSFVLETSGGSQVTLANFKTALGVASGITSQGAFATLSSAAYGSGLLTGFGSLAALSNGSTLTAGGITGQGALATRGDVYLGSSFVLETSGGSQVTLANFKTSLGIASGFTGQGAFATVSSVAYGSGFLTGFGSLAALSNGSTLTAGGITGQGAFATLNSAAYGSGLLTGFGTVAALSSITGLTAGGITGQGDLATANRATLALGEQSIVNSEWAAPGTYPPTGWENGSNQTAGATTRTLVTSGPRNTVKGANTTTPANATYFDILRQKQTLAELKKNALPVNSGDRIAASVLVCHNSSASAAYGVIVYWDGAGAFVSGGPSLSSVTKVANGDSGDPNDFALSSGTFTVPATAKFASLIACRVVANGGANPTGWAMSPMLCAVPSGQTVVPPYSPSSPDRLADVTSVNTAAGFTGQAALATLNFVTIGTNLRLADGTTVATTAAVVTASGTAAGITGQGGLATQNFVLFSSTVRRADGTTVVTDAMVVTTLGVSSGFTGQGALATLNTAGTSQIDANAVTVGTVFENDAAQAFDQTWTSVASISITTPDANSLIFLPFSAYVESVGFDATIGQARIKRGATVIYETDLAGEPPTLDFETPIDGPVHYAPTFNGQCSGFDTDAPGAAGTYTYTLEFRTNGTGSNAFRFWQATRRRFLGLLFKR